MYLREFSYYAPLFCLNGYLRTSDHIYSYSKHSKPWITKIRIRKQVGRKIIKHKAQDNDKTLVNYKRNTNAISWQDTYQYKVTYFT